MNNAKFKLLAALVSSSMLLTGCGGGSSSSDDGTSNTDTPDTTIPDTVTNPYSGSSSISGAVVLSALSGSDSSAIEGAGGAQFLQMSAASIRTPSALGTQNAIIKLYVVGTDGELQDTGINCAFNNETDDAGNPTYTCPNVADGKQYVVQYLRLLEGNKALEMKVNIEVPEGSPGVDSGEVSPESTVVVDTIIKAILSATEGKGIDPTVVDEIIGAVKQTVVTLIRSGAIQVPSMVVEAPKDPSGNYITDVTVLRGEPEVNFADNEQLDSASSNLLSDESVASEVDAVKVEIEVREFERIDVSSEAGKRKLVERVFNEMLDGDVPQFIAKFFGDKFVDGETKPIQALFDGIAAGLRIDPRLQFDLAQVTRSGALAAFQQKLAQIHGLLERKANGTITEEDRKAFREIPSVIPALFPAETWKDKAISETDELNVPQAIAFVIFVTDVHIPELLKTAGKDVDGLVSVEKGEDGAVDVEVHDAVEFDPMHFDPAFAQGAGGQPGIMQLYGFFDPEHLNSLSGVEISWLDIMPDKAWIPNPDGMGGREVDMLRANVCISDLSQLAQMLTPQGADGNGDLTVELTYPTSSGTMATVELLSEAGLYMPPPGEMPPEGQGPDGGPGFDSCFTLDPWRQAQSAAGTDGPVELTEADIISDFASGTYKVEVKRAGGVVASREFQQKVLVGMTDVRPHLTAPNGMPEWPKECEGRMGPCPEWDALQQQWLADGGTTTFAINEDTDGDGTPDKAKVTISWEKPDVELPEGVKIAYSLNVGLNRGCDETGCDWEHIYDTWQQDRKLFGTSYTLPVPLDRVEIGQGSYNVNVCALFIDTETGREIGRGSCGWAEFQVGDPLDLNATFTITGAVPAGLDAKWKVALVKEFFNADALIGQWQQEVVHVADVVDGTYSLTPTIGDYLGSDSNVRHQVVLFRDDDSNGQLDNPEPIIWPNGQESVWFETWGGVLRVVKEELSDDGEFKRREVVITGGEAVEGPDFSYLDSPAAGGMPQ